MEQIRPEDRRHKQLVKLVKDCFELSHDSISKRYPKWEKVDQMDRCFVDTGEKDIKGKKKNPFDRQVYIPISRAVKDVLLTYYYQVFFGKRPFFQIDGRGPEDVGAAKRMEVVVDYQCERQRFGLVGYNFLNDVIKYSYGNLKCLFMRNREQRFKNVSNQVQFPFPHTETERIPETVMTYEGPTFHNSDPYMTFHDPRVPASRVQDGQWVGWAYARSLYYLKKMHAQNVYFNIEYIRTVPKETKLDMAQFGGSERHRTLGLGDSEDFVNLESSLPDKTNPMYLLREEVIEIIPKKYGLSESNMPEKWLLTTLNNHLLVRADRVVYEHSKFPDVCAEYDYDGYSQFTPGYYEGVEGLQDLLNWLYNSHMDNTRRFLNDNLIIDPTVIELKDILQPNPAKIIRLRKKLYDQHIPIDSVIKQLDVRDVTGTHINDANAIVDLIQRKAHAPDALQGVESDIKRTATEIAKMTGSSGQILQTQAQVIYAQAMVPLAEMLVSLNQQLLSEGRYFRIIGDYAKNIIKPDPRYPGGDAIFVSPDEIQGYFDFPVQDGTLPVRASENAEVWAKVFEVAGTNPIIQSQIDIWFIFKQLTESLGIKNIEDARIQANVIPDEQALGMEQAGNVVPLDQMGQTLPAGTA